MDKWYLIFLIISCLFFGVVSATSTIDDDFKIFSDYMIKEEMGNHYVNDEGFVIVILVHFSIRYENMFNYNGSYKVTDLSNSYVNDRLFTEIKYAFNIYLNPNIKI